MWKGQEGVRAGLLTSRLSSWRLGRKATLNCGNGRGGEARGFQSREQVEAREMHSWMSRTWDAGVVRMGSDGLEEARGHLVYPEHTVQLLWP